MSLPTEKARESVGLPVRPLLYTLDQIATLIDVTEPALRHDYVWFDGREVGAHPNKKLLARNLADDGDKPDWRVAERELVRWLRLKGFRIYERGWAQA